MKTIVLVSALMLMAGLTAAEARTARYGGASAVFCNKTGCHDNPNYGAQVKRQQDRAAKMNLQ